MPSQHWIGPVVQLLAGWVTVTTGAVAVHVPVPGWVIVLGGEVKVCVCVLVTVDVAVVVTVDTPVVVPVFQGVATARTAREAIVRPRANIASKGVEVGELRVGARCREAGFVCCSTGQQ